MKKYVALLLLALLAVIIVQSLMLSRPRSEIQLLHEARQQTEQSRSEAAEEEQSEAESLRSEAARLRAEAQDLRQALERARSLQSPSSEPARTVMSGRAPSALPLTDHNRVLLEYIGEPVDPSLNTDVRYTKEGLISAVQFAAGNAGISVQRLEGEDSEYPCLLGIFCEPQDYAKLIEEINKLDGYEYNGSVSGSEIFHVLNITPSRVYPVAAREQINRRVT